VRILVQQDVAEIKRVRWVGRVDPAQDAVEPLGLAEIPCILIGAGACVKLVALQDLGCYVSRSSHGARRRVPIYGRLAESRD
jgi:hypothetical protein